MNGSFSLIPQWMPTDHGPEEIRQTSGFMRISVRNRLLTRVDDDRAKSVRDSVFLSSYPLALWFASSWWRLCWEPKPKEVPSVNWYMSHEMHGAGHGYLWPPLRFESDGEEITITCTPSHAESKESIRYLNDCHESIPVSEFREVVELFIQTVLARLEAIGVMETDLHTLWREVKSEQADSRITLFRKMEALLGFDPDEVSESIASALQRLPIQAGEAAAIEITAACSQQDPTLILGGIEETTHSHGILCDFSGITELRKINLPHPIGTPPWDQGRNLARAVRNALNIGGAVSNQILSDVAGLTVQNLIGGDAPMARMPLSLAIRKGDDHREVNLLFRSKHRHGRRFGLSRWMIDLLVASDQDRWLPATGSKMARQKMQRAFAAEFLAPIDALQDFLGADRTDEDRIDEAAEYFDVSSQTVWNQLTNHDLIPSETIRTY